MSWEERRLLWELSILTSEDFAVHIKTLALSSGVAPKQIPKFVKKLREAGLVLYMRGLMTEDGEVAGSGYAITRAGQELVEKLEMDDVYPTGRYDQ